MRLLYAGAFKDSTRPRQANAGLWYDKYCDRWHKANADGRTAWTLESWRDRESRKDVNPKLDWIRSVTGAPVGNTDELAEANDRRVDMLEAFGGKPLFFTNSYAFVSGLGREHPVENGFAWHHILGVPYLPGSSVKGMVRAWAEWVLKSVYSPM